MVLSRNFNSLLILKTNSSVATCLAHPKPIVWTYLWTGLWLPIGLDNFLYCEDVINSKLTYNMLTRLRQGRKSGYFCLIPWKKPFIITLLAAGLLRRVYSLSTRAVLWPQVWPTQNSSSELIKCSFGERQSVIKALYCKMQTNDVFRVRT